VRRPAFIAVGDPRRQALRRITGARAGSCPPVKDKARRRERRAGAPRPGGAPRGNCRPRPAAGRAFQSRPAAARRGSRVPVARAARDPHRAAARAVGAPPRKAIHDARAHPCAAGLRRARQEIHRGATTAPGSPMWARPNLPCLRSRYISHSGTVPPESWHETISRPSRLAGRDPHGTPARLLASGAMSSRLRTDVRKTRPVAAPPRMIAHSAASKPGSPSRFPGGPRPPAWAARGRVWAYALPAARTPRSGARRAAQE